MAWRRSATPSTSGTIKVPSYVAGAINDHLTPWKSTYRTTQFLAGDCTFALSNAGHIASLVNPPGNPKASFYTGPRTRPSTGRLARGCREAESARGGSTGATG